MAASMAAASPLPVCSFQESFDNVRLWMDEIDRYACENVSRLLVGNKSDLLGQKVVDAAAAQVTNASEGVRTTDSKMLIKMPDLRAEGKDGV